MARLSLIVRMRRRMEKRRNCDVYSPPKTMMISGVPAKGNADFPPEAVQHFHEKPTPTHDARPAHCSRPIIIQQPRK